MLVSGVFGLLIAKPFSMILRFFPPLVTGTVISVIGLSLIGADISLIAGQQYTTDFDRHPHAEPDFGDAVAHRAGRPGDPADRPDHPVSRGFISQIAVLISIVVGTVVAWPMGLIHLGEVEDVQVVRHRRAVPLRAPKFQAAAIISMCIVMLVTYTESTADMLAVGEMVDKDLSPNDLARGLATDGLSALLAGFMNLFPDTAYAENVGLIGMTRVKSRWVVTVCGVLLLIMGIVPKIGQVVAGLPGPVIGGAATVMFAMVTSIGIRTLHKVDFEGNHNLLIVATSLAVGLLPAFNPHCTSSSRLVPDHLRLGDHVDRHRGVHPEPALQPLERGAEGGHQRAAGGHGARRREPRRGRDAEGLDPRLLVGRSLVRRSLGLGSPGRGAA